MTKLININHPERWKMDTMQSVDFYNKWFLDFAPRTFREARERSIKDVEKVFTQTANLCMIGPDTIKGIPEAFHILRLSTAPPLAKARISGLAQVPASVVENLEMGRLPQRMRSEQLTAHLESIARMLKRLLDYDIFPWIEKGNIPTKTEKVRAASVIGDRLCTTLADPIIRGEQERRQLNTLGRLLDENGYKHIESHSIDNPFDFPCGCYAYHYNIRVNVGVDTYVNIPVDLAVKPKTANEGSMPIMVECKSAGDYTNTNKRRKEEAVKMAQLRGTYGTGITYLLFLCGYFDCGYLGYEAAEGIDWVWEHRAEDLLKLGL